MEKLTLAQKDDLKSERPKRALAIFPQRHSARICTADPAAGTGEWAAKIAS